MSSKNSGKNSSSSTSTSKPAARRTAGNSSSQDKKSRTTGNSDKKIRAKLSAYIRTNFRQKKKLLKSKGEKKKTEVQEPGPWDPFAAFAKRQKAVEDFFNGYHIQTDMTMEYRGRRFCFHVGKEVTEYPANISKVTDGVRTGSVESQDSIHSWTTYHDNKDAGIGASQHYPEAQTAHPVGNTGSTQAEECFTDNVEDLFSASANSCGYPICPSVNLLQMIQVGKYGQTDLSLWDSDVFQAVPDSLDLTAEEEATVDEKDPNDSSFFVHGGYDADDNIENDNDDDEHYSSENEDTASEIRPSGPGKETVQDANVSRGLLDHQVTAIVWILSRLYGVLPKLKSTETAEEESNRMKLRGPKYSGCIFADSMGLGKTRTVVALLELMLAHELHVTAGEGPGEKSYRPILILCPNPTVAKQWIVELLLRIRGPRIEQIIVSGQNSSVYSKSKKVRWLTRGEFKSWPPTLEYVWDTSCPTASRTILVMPIDTWADRIYSNSSSDWGSPQWFSSDGSPSRRFSMVCVDEAHKVKNNNTLAWKSVFSLNRQFTLLVTATPCLNTLSDLMGLAKLLWGNAELYLQSKRPQIWSQVKKMRLIEDLKNLDTADPWCDIQLAAGRPSLLEGIIGKGSSWKSQYIDIQQTKEYLPYFERLAILRRGPSSTLFRDWEKTQRVSLGGVFPAVHYQTVCIQPDAQFEESYQSLHIDLLTKHFDDRGNMQAEDSTKSNQGGNKKQPSKKGKPSDANLGAIHRQLQIASSSMDVLRLDQILKTHKKGTMSARSAMSATISEMRKVNVDFLKIAKCFFIADGKEPPRTMLEVLEHTTRGSPVFRFILYYLRKNILNSEPGEKIKKLLIVENRPIVAYFYELCLQFLGLNARTLHANLTEPERQALIDSFNSDDEESVQVFIQMYTVGFAGTNLHKNCSQVIVATQAHSFAVQAQAIHRIIRVGQTQEVKVILCKVNNTYSDYMEGIQIRKLIPELASRVQGEQHDMLARLLSRYQSEVEDAWKSKEGRKLREDPGLLFQSASSVYPKPKVTAHSGPNKESHKSFGSFLDLKTRRHYIQEFTELPRELRGTFNHPTNQLRRLLSFHKGENVPREPTKEDLDDPTNLERSLELAYRFRHGTDNAKILPYPAIDFNMVPIGKLVKLQGAIARVDFTELDMDAVQEAISEDFDEGEAPKTAEVPDKANEELSDDEFQEEVVANTTFGLEDMADEDGDSNIQDASSEEEPLGDGRAPAHDISGLQASTPEAPCRQVKLKLKPKIKREPIPDQDTNRMGASNLNAVGLASNIDASSLGPSTSSGLQAPTTEVRPQTETIIKREPGPEKTTNRAGSSHGNDAVFGSGFTASFPGFSGSSQSAESTRDMSTPRTSVSGPGSGSYDGNGGDSSLVDFAILRACIEQSQRGTKREAGITSDSPSGDKQEMIDDRQPKRLKQDAIEESLRGLQDEELD